MRKEGYLTDELLLFPTHTLTLLHTPALSTDTPAHSILPGYAPFLSASYSYIAIRRNALFHDDHLFGGLIVTGFELVEIDTT